MGLNEEQKKERSYAYISCASDNREQVFKSAVVPMQQQYGLRVYADETLDEVNDKWVVSMLRNISGADVVVAFISQSYVESYTCFLELLNAVNNKKQIVFVSLEDQLHLGDTTVLSEMEQGIKNEILNQGANIATNINGSSDDLMRAMKSAYTRISTMLEQDALSKYYISGAFINFFRDASINQITINDLKDVMRTIESVSSDVFDQSLITASVKPADREDAAPAAGAFVQSVIPAAAVHTQLQFPGQSEPVSQPVQEFISVEEPAVSFTPDQPTGQIPVETLPQKEGFITKLKNFKGQSSKFKAGVIGGAGAALLAIMLFFFVVSGGIPKRVTNMPYTYYGVEVLYTGEWKDNKPNGQGMMIFTDGMFYEGEFKDGQCNGQGTLTYANGDVYEGEWKDSRCNGQGTMTCASGDVYEGEWKDDYANGQGTATYANGNVYEGEWKDGKCNGQGTITYADGTVYEGEWKGGRFNGQGTLTFANGDVYEGEWKDSKYNGQGTLTLVDGSVYKGEWKDNQKNGQGTMTYADGTVKTGLWEDDIFVD